MVSWFRRLRARIRYRHFERDLAREIETHRALKADEHRDRGLAAPEARAAAARDLGNVTLMREDARGVWIAPWLQSVWQDLRYAAASYRRQPLFTIGAVLVLSLGTSLVTIMFSLAHATFLRPWLVPDPASVVLLRVGMATRGASFQGLSIPEFRHLQEHATSIDVFYTARSVSEELADGAATLGRVSTLYVSGNYFSSLRIGMRAGRGFVPAEDDYRSPSLVAVISERVWRESFNSDPAVIGRVVSLGRRQVTIIGVAPASRLRDNVGSSYDLALPLAALATERREIDVAGVGRHAVDALKQFTDPRQSSPVATFGGRLASGASPETAAAELTTLSAQFRADNSLSPSSITASDTRPISRSRGALWSLAQVMLLAVSLVLALTCANVGNMLLARGLARRREIGVRLALGAGRARLVRQLVTEAAALSGMAAAVGLTMTAAFPRILAWAIVPDRGLIERPEFYAPTAAVFWFAAGIAVVSSMLCGLAPALRATKLTVSAAMDRQGAPARRVWLQRALLSTQIAVTTILLVGAGLLTRAMGHALESPTGFDLNQLQVVSFATPRPFPSLASRQAFFSELERRVAASDLPAAFMDRPPVVDDRFSVMVRTHAQERPQPFREVEVSPAYFEVSGVKLTAGRAPRSGTVVREVVVSESVVGRLWAGTDPIGQTLLETQSSVVVVGVATDATLNSLGDIEPVFYTAPEYVRGVFLLRDATDAAVTRLRAMATALEPEIVVTTRPLRAYASDSLQMTLVGSWLAWAIGGLALVLAIVGAIGVFAYAVEARRREIGIRLALGARPAQVIALILRTSQSAAILGLAGGLTLSAAMAPLLRSYLYGLSPFDLRSYAQIAVILLAAAAIATWAPARRAVRINPAETLRVE